MPIPTYLAMTAAEISQNAHLPDKIGWMACHFSPYSTGLSNCPHHLPPGSLLILNDRTPVRGHDPRTVSDTLCQLARQFACDGILLDLQRPGVEETARIAAAICDAAPCPVAVTEEYCQGTTCAVFLSPPLHIPLEESLAPWQDRNIWLEAAVEDICFTVTKNGCTVGPLPCVPTNFPHKSAESFCRYHIAAEADAIRFSLRRTKEDVAAMIAAADNIHCCVGLYQQLK